MSLYGINERIFIIFLYYPKKKNFMSNQKEIFKKYKKARQNV